MGDIEEVWREEFPEDFEERLDSILACVNTEYKSTVLSEGLTNSWQTQYDIRDRIQTKYGDMLDPDSGIYKDYSEWTFIPIGAVAKGKAERKGEHISNVYKLTEEGLEFANPAAKLAIKTACNLDTSFYEVFGRTASRGDSRSPYNRAKILKGISSEGDVRKCDLMEEFTFPENDMQRHLEKLSGAGLIDYKSISMEDSTNPDELNFQERKSNARITEHGEFLLSNFLYPLERGLKDEDMSQINQELEEINPDLWKKYVRRGVDMYRSVAPNYKAKPKEVRKNEILSVLEEEDARPCELKDKIGISPHGYLKELREEGKVEREREGRAVYYSAVD